MNINEAINLALNNCFTAYWDFDKGPPRFGILGFENEHYWRLYNNGYLQGDFWQYETNNDSQPPERFIGGLCIAFLDDEDNDLFHYDTPKYLRKMLQHAHFAYYDIASGRLTLAAKDSLFDLLPKVCTEPVIESLPLIDSYTPESKKSPELNKATIERLKNMTNFLGRSCTCDYSYGKTVCGDPMCYSEFAWIQNGVVLLYMSGGGGIIRALWLLPFRTNAYCADASKLQHGYTIENDSFEKHVKSQHACHCSDEATSASEDYQEAE